MTSWARRRRQRFEKPADPPEGYIWIANGLVPISAVEDYCKAAMANQIKDGIYKEMRKYEGYNWRSEARKRSS